jgi:4'-phosphopantetheinyl transferase
VISENEIHVWVANLRCEPHQEESLAATLSTDERARMSRLKSAQARVRFAAARSALRAILGRYLDLPPEQICFSYNRHGKPALAGEQAESLLRFNLSHSQDVALCAVAKGREVGVDVERVRAEFAGLPIAKHFFSPSELAALQALSPVLRTEAFFRYWTRKEAFLKALGEGLTRAPQLFTVSLRPDEPVAWHDDSADARSSSGWSLTDLALGSDSMRGYVAALAVEGPISALQYQRYEAWEPGHQWR